MERARRALSRVDAELDVARVLSRVRDGVPRASAATRRTGSPGHRVRSARTGGDDLPETVEVAVLRPVDGSGPPGRVDRPAHTRRPGGLLGAVAAAVVVAALAGGTWWVGRPTSPAVAARLAGAPVPASGTLHGGAGAEDVLARVRDVVSAGGYCAVRARTRSGDTVVAQRVDASTPPAPTEPLVLGDGGQPITVLGALVVGALRSLAPGGTTGDAPGPVSAVSVTPAPELGDRDADGAVRLRVTASGPPLRDADVTRVEYVVDTATWLPRTQELTVQPDEGEPVVVATDLEWTVCGG